MPTLPATADYLEINYQPGLRQEFQTDGTVPEPHPYDPSEPFRLNQCITEGEAVQWLRAEQAARPVPNGA